MSRGIWRRIGAAMPVAFLAAIGSMAQTPRADGLGGPLQGLTPTERERFEAGKDAFAAAEEPDEGLGPIFNGVGCAQCHQAGAVGGAGVDPTVSVVRRIGGLRDGVYTDLPELGGPVLQARSIKEFDPACPVEGETIPAEASFVSHRITTPLFGAGLIEAIPDREILARAGATDPDGIRGVPNWIADAGAGRKRVGRFGWKAQHASLEVFAADAYLNEMGVTSALFPDENQPQGQPIPDGWDEKDDPEDDDGDVARFADFMRLLAPPARRAPIGWKVPAGERIFREIRCAACHTPSLRTGDSPIRALAHRNVPLFSDLLLHRMGALADGIQQSDARGDQFRTAPLWGLSHRQFFLHDGRAGSIEEAIAWHDGEATRARERYTALRPADRDALLAFLRSL